MIRASAIVACLLSTALLAADPPASTFRAGAATSNITPALGSAIIGGFLPFPATNVHDELHARCLVLDDGKTKLALVVLDLLGINYGVSHEARKLIEQETGIPSANVLISAVHTHSAASALGEMLSSSRRRPTSTKPSSSGGSPTASNARSIGCARRSSGSSPPRRRSTYSTAAGSSSPARFRPAPSAPSTR